MASGYLQLVRPANVVTAAADVVAGFAVAGAPAPGRLAWLVVGSMCLYASGIALNDVMDRAADALERPERPIPSGRVPARRAAWLGGGLLAAGVAVAAQVGAAAATVAALLGLAILLYNAVAKRSRVAGPLTMGSCRGLNFALGLAVAPAALATYWPLSLVAVTYIAGVTMMSRGEVTGSRRPLAALSVGLVVLAILGLAGVSLVMAGPHTALAAAIILLLAWRVLPPFWAALSRLEPVTIRQAVKQGVLSLVLLDAALAATFAGPGYAAGVLVTGLAAAYLAKFFAVT